MLTACGLPILVYLILCSCTNTVFGDANDHLQVENYATELKTLLDAHEKLAKARSSDPDILRSTRDWWDAPAQKIRPYLTSNNFSQCNLDLVYALESLISPNPQEDRMWALQMLDSFGKPPAGILRGQINWPGSFDECLQISAPTSVLFGKTVGGFSGRYAWLTILFNNTNQNETININVGACFPSSCADDYSITNDYHLVIKILERNSWLKKLLKFLPELGVRFLPNYYPLTTASIACVCVCAIFGAMVIAGSAVDVFQRWKQRARVNMDDVPSGGPLGDGQSELSGTDAPCNIINSDNVEYHSDNVALVPTPNDNRISMIIEVLVCFSAISNGESILNTSTAKGELKCIHGIRFLSMAWIILCHSYDFTLMTIGNALDLVDKVSSWPIQVILQGSYSVDTFFVLSGCLLTYHFLRNKDKFNSAKSWIAFYVHRYVRLTPVYAVLLFVFATWLSSLNNGPFWTDLNSQTCSKKWWWNFLYINNFLQETEMCMPWSWYLANDMQFYVISPIFLVAFKRNRIAGVLVVFVLLVACWVSTAVISRINNLPVIFANTEQNVADFQQEEITLGMIYMRPYTRIGSYLMGVLLGYLLIRANGSRNFLHKSVVVLGWVLSQTLSLLLLYGVYKANLGPITSSAHNALTRSAWGISLGWVIYACLTGHAGPVNILLSWKGWIPLSRLTYCAYLVHPMVMMWYTASLRTTVYFSDSQVVIQYLSFVVLSYGVAFIASLLFEAPIIKLEKLLRDR